jgi:ornithine cyclodeaminase
MSVDAPRWIGADEVFALGFEGAARAVQDALRAGVDPSADFHRGILDVSHGQLLLMPSESADFVGIKVATVAPGNPERGLERIQGTYLLMDAATLSPVALLDGTALTTLRTPAVSAAAADLLAPAVSPHLVVFGSGPQALGHVRGMQAIRRIERVTVVGRNAERARAFVERLVADGVDARVGTPDAVADAQLVVCATTARDPLFDGALVADDACVVAVGSHEPGARELDAALMARAQVVVEDQAVALREAGDVIMAVDEALLDPFSLVPMRDIVTGDLAVDRERPRVFKSSGMSWEDLVVAAAVHRRG